MTFDSGWRSESAFRSAILQRWPALTLDDLEVAGRDRSLLVAFVVLRYGIGWEQAHYEVEDWVNQSA